VVQRPTDLGKSIKVLQVAAVDVTIGILLAPLIEALGRDGYEVHIACSPGPHLTALEASGHRVHPIRIQRRVRAVSHLRSLWLLYRLMRRERFAIVHVHTPVAAALGRVAARLARVPIIIYTAHGFYFHELMPSWTRRGHVWVEKALARWCTDALFTQSAEDRDTAVEERFLKDDRVFWISNGVCVDSFALPPQPGLRAKLGLSQENRIIGFIGRLVREKGVEELLTAMQEVARRNPEARLLVVGDTLDSDRDRRTARRLKETLRRSGPATLVKFAGFRQDIPQLLSIMDLLVLPSHREGMPRTILEAMAAGKPVVATNIRGSREEVLDGVTGLLVPVRNPPALAEAISRLLMNREEATQMGEAGRRRAQESFDEKMVVKHQVAIYQEMAERREAQLTRKRAHVQ